VVPQVSLSCLRDCQIFLFRGGFHVEGQGGVFRTCCSYLVKDEEWIGLCGSNTVIVIMEEGEQKGICRQRTLEAQTRVRDKAVRKSATECLVM
jgi:hypothetical protein